jgi:hypothetical protein
MKTVFEINDEVDALREIKKLVPQYNFFGDSIWDQIDRQIEALVDEWTDDDAYDAIDEGDISQDEFDMVCEAIAWAEGAYEEYEEDGETIDRPSLSWKSLVK